MSQIPQEVLDQAMRDIQDMEHTQSVVHFETTWQQALGALAFLQQIVRHPAMKNHPFQINAEGFAIQLINRLNKTPALEQVIEAGWPTQGNVN
jgi:hypothetical protein